MTEFIRKQYCAFCRKPVTEGKEVKMVILIAKERHVEPKTRNYCSTRCGQCDQMENEA